MFSTNELLESESRHWWRSGGPQARVRHELLGLVDVMSIPLGDCIPTEFSLMIVRFAPLPTLQGVKLISVEIRISCLSSSFIIVFIFNYLNLDSQIPLVLCRYELLQFVQVKDGSLPKSIERSGDKSSTSRSSV